MNKDKVILISGANRGIGRKIADRLYQEGYQLSLGVRQLGCFKTTLLDNSERVLVYHYEARDKQSPIDWVKATINRFGCLDGVINCAGILRKVQFEDDNEEALDELWEINVKAPMRLTREAFPYLRQSGEGRVINVISIICPSYVNTDMARDLRVDPQTMTQPEDLAEIIATVLRLPNTAHLNEILVNCANE